MGRMWPCAIEKCDSPVPARNFPCAQHLQLASIRTRTEFMAAANNYDKRSLQFWRDQAVFEIKSKLREG